MILLSESIIPPTRRDFSSADADIRGLTKTARRLNYLVYEIPHEDERHSAEEVLQNVPIQPQETPALWQGYLPSISHYRGMYEAAQRRKIKLPNTPEEHQRILEFDLAYPSLVGLTPESLIISSPGEAAQCAAALGFPLFVKGAIFSRKSLGLKGCVAHNLEELTTLITQLLPLQKSLGKVIVRRFADLKKSEREWLEFPMSREFRVFLYRAEVVAYGFYWPLFDEPMTQLSAEEEQQMLGLAKEAARRLNVGYVSIDVAQQKDNSWIVIETGDPQFSGLSFIDPSELLSKLRALCDKIA
jgi:hypothetical protein